ncbi:partitioning defective protein 6 isoform X2 [Brevipalpus obovatus]|uniref:partitioning defective protein 6 isoform X2 n=1 Tax=Brevipalpus obovatus TaxID=246614 RepID=UPI003D9DD919
MISEVHIKSKFCAEFRRYSISRDDVNSFDNFFKKIQGFHKLWDIPFTISYVDPNQGDLLPINNDDNLKRAVVVSHPRCLLKLILTRTVNGTSYFDSSYSSKKKNNFLNDLIPLTSSNHKIRPAIGLPQDFREVSSIIDVPDIPRNCRRVRLVKHGSDKPLGFYIRDGTSVRVVSHGIEKVSGVFISRLVPGGIAESSGILSINDEILEVNGIDVTGKTLDQVTDMMIANSSNLIITIRPANQDNLTMPSSSSLPSISDDEDSEIKDQSSYFS